MIGLMATRNLQSSSELLFPLQDPNGGDMYELESIVYFVPLWIFRRTCWQLQPTIELAFAARISHRGIKVLYVSGSVETSIVALPLKTFHGAGVMRFLCSVKWTF
ncbi:hypothetical protein KP509_17G057600 [Ceratopteris richardii]|uniref:Uncharacterized protein n=1 Tax=Ceratopteris richardii TaxID=49495 RepID=A0A8T2SZR1_CERRI|nr:hypothetical protein KP509_17G057600 [Ceratopteris richardii]